MVLVVRRDGYSANHSSADGPAALAGPIPPLSTSQDRACQREPENARAKSPVRPATIFSCRHSAAVLYAPFACGS